MMGECTIAMFVNLFVDNKESDGLVTKLTFFFKFLMILVIDIFLCVTIDSFLNTHFVLK